MSIIFNCIFADHDDILLLFPPGAGKTTKAVAAMVAKASAGEKTLYAGVTRSLCQQATAWANIQGDVMAEKLPRTSKNCDKFHQINNMAGKGWSAVEYVCRACPKFNANSPVESGCEWWRQWDDDQHLTWAVTHHHLASGLPFRYLHPKTLVLDEGTVQACLGWAGGQEDGFTDLDLENLAFSLPVTDPGIHDVTLVDPSPGAAVRLLMNMTDRIRSWEKPGSPMIKMMDRLRERHHVSQVTGTEAAGFLLGLDNGVALDNTTLRLLDDLIREREENKKVATTMPPGKRHIIKALPEPSIFMDPIPPNVLAPLIDALEAARQIIEAQQSGRSVSAGAIPLSLHLHRSQNGDSFFSIRIRTFSPIRVPADCRVVGLDATGNKELFERCVGRPVKEMRVHVPFKGNIVQTTDMRLPKATLLNDQTTTNRWVESIKPYLIRLHEMHGKVLVVTFKSMALRLQSEMKSHKGILFRWFYGVRGEDFSSYPVQVTIGYPMSPPTSTYMDTAAIYQGEDIDTTWENEWRPYLEAGDETNPESLGLDVDVPKDPRLRAIHELSSDHEFYQVACSRNRILRNDHLSVVMSNIPFLPEFRVPVRLSSTQEILQKGHTESSISERVHKLANRLLDKLGWVSRHLLEAVFVENVNSLVLSEEFELVAGCLIYNTISHPATNSLTPAQKVFNQRMSIRLASGFREAISSRRLREAWSSFPALGQRENIEIGIKVLGAGPGRPIQDTVVGDCNLWLWDNRDLVTSPDLIVTMDGVRVDGSTLDRLRDVSEPGQRLVVDQDDLTPDGFLRGSLDSEEREEARIHMLRQLQEPGEDIITSDLEQQAERLVQLLP